MDETRYIWMDGSFVDWKDATIHVLSHTLHYGMGIFEGIRFYETPRGPAIFRLKDHTTRFFAGSKNAFLEIPYSQEQIDKAIIKTVSLNEVNSGYIRPLAYFGYGKMGLNPKGAPTNISIAAWPWGSYLGEQAVRVKTSTFMRIHPQSTDVEAKITGHYLNSIYSSKDAKDNGYDESLLLDFAGNVAEGPGENIFIVKDGKLITPPAGSILSGITRKSIMEIARDEGIEVLEQNFRVEDVYNADEAFFTGTAAEITPIHSLDDRKIGVGAPGPISQKLQSIYMSVVQGQNEKYDHWLTYVNEVDQ